MSTPFHTSVQLSDEKREKLVGLLNQTLANTLDLYTQVKQAHWNIRGAHFIARHELFDELAAHLIGFSDDLAERAGILGGYARGTARMVADKSSLPEFDIRASTGDDFLRAIAKRYGAYCGALREGIDVAESQGDPATEDLLTELLRVTEKDMWFVESHVEVGHSTSSSSA